MLLLRNLFAIPTGNPGFSSQQIKRCIAIDFELTRVTSQKRTNKELVFNGTTGYYDALVLSYLGLNKSVLPCTYVLKNSRVSYLLGRVEIPDSLVYESKAILETQKRAIDYFTNESASPEVLAEGLSEFGRDLDASTKLANQKQKNEIQRIKEMWVVTNWLEKKHKAHFRYKKREPKYYRSIIYSIRKVPPMDNLRPLEEIVEEWYGENQDK